MAAKDVFNSAERGTNMMRASIVGSLCHVAQLIPTFVGRTLFLRVLSEEYLGITGLFTDVLLILSLADLGIATAISYRFYEPVSRRDMAQVGRLMNFFKRVYAVIILAILALGLALMPFVKLMIKDAGEIPPDVNIYVVYLLFLIDTVSSYLFVYKQTLLAVDQRNDLVSLFQTTAIFASTTVKIAILLISRSYIAYLITGIATTVAINFLVSLWITHKYRPIFEIREPLPKAEQKQIYQDTKACLLHKAGLTLLSSTDSVVLSKMVGLAATGLYSNYSIIIANLTAILAKLFGNYVSSIGNSKVKEDPAQHYTMYRRLRFLDLFVTSLSTVCLYTLLSDFIAVWLGPQFLMDRFTVVCLCIQYFLAVSRLINTSYINGCGWFIKDKPRSLIEAALNLVLAVCLAARFGTAGVFLGTVIADIATVCWREPYILYRYEFHAGQAEYWLEFGSFALLTAALCAAVTWGKSFFSICIGSWLGWLLEALFAAVVSFAVLVLFFFRTDSFRYLVSKARDILRKLLRRFGSPRKNERSF